MYTRAITLFGALIAASVFLLAIPVAEATLYAPGATLEPDCAPTDPNCGVQSNVAQGTIGQIPYYAANGNVLAATSTFTILSNGNVGIGTTSPYSMLSVAGQVVAQNFVATSTTATSTFQGIVAFGTSSDTFLQRVDTSTLRLSNGAPGPGAIPLYIRANNQAVTLTDGPSIRTGGGGSLILNASASSTGSLYLNNDVAKNVLALTGSGGNFGIGITNPSAFVHISSTTPTSDIFRITAGSNDIVVNSLGRLGIGTTSPGADLHIASTNTFALALERSGASGNNVFRRSNGTLAVPTVVSNGDVIWQSTWQGYDGANYQSAAMMSSAIDGATISSASMPGRLVFSTTPSGSVTVTERMRIDNLGNVGIGTTTPWGQLSVNPNGISGPSFAIGSSTKTDFVVTNAGNVGIGTASPNILAFSTNARVLSIVSSSGAQRAAFELANQTNGGSSALGSIEFIGTSLQLAQIKGAADGTIDSAYLSFSTQPTGGTLTERMRVTSTGNVGIGTTSPDMLLSVGSATPVGNVAHFENSTGSCYINPTTTALVCSSDARLKKNIATLSAFTASSTILDAIAELNPVTYNWNSEATGTPIHTGFIAQEVQPIFPDLVSSAPDGFLTMNYAGLTPYLVKGLQELLGKVSSLAAAVAGFAQKFTTNELCVGSTCVTESQLKTLLDTAGTQPSQDAPANAIIITDAPSLPDSSSTATTTEASATTTSDTQPSTGTASTTVL